MRFLSTLIASTLGTLVALGVVFLLLFMFMFALVASTDVEPRIEAGSVLVIEMAGDIPEVITHDPLTQAFQQGPVYDLRDLKAALEKAAADDRIEAVWLQIQGINASWAKLEEIRAALQTYKASGKPLVASSGEFPIAEPEYFIASTADEVYAAPEGLFEFNGFYIAAEFYKGLLDKLEIEAQVVRVGEYKSAVEPFTQTQLSDESEEQLRAILDTQNEAFMNAVAESRGLSAGTLNTLADEQPILSSTQAHEADLLDDLLFYEEVEDVLKDRVGIEEADDLPTVSMASYIKVPPSDAGLEVGSEGEIAVVYAVGAIMPGESGYSPNPLFGGTTVGPETFNEAIREARTSDDVDAVVVRIDSPGGFAPAADAMLHEIELTAAEKPVLVSMGSVAASGGYWMALGGDTIVADPLSITGSIGVFSLFFDLGGFFQNKLGITHDFLTTSPFADLYSGVRPLNDQERQLLQRTTDATYQQFIQKVAAKRGLSLEEADAVARGRVWLGVDAQDVGLVDVLGSLDMTIELAAERAGLEPGSYRVRTLPRPKSPIEQFSEALQARAASLWMNLRYAPSERSLLEHTRLLNQLRTAHGTVQAWLPAQLEIR